MARQITDEYVNGLDYASGPDVTVFKKKKFYRTGHDALEELYMLSPRLFIDVVKQLDITKQTSDALTFEYDEYKHQIILENRLTTNKLILVQEQIYAAGGASSRHIAENKAYLFRKENRALRFLPRDYVLEETDDWKTTALQSFNFVEYDTDIKVEVTLPPTYEFKPLEVIKENMILIIAITANEAKKFAKEVMGWKQSEWVYVKEYADMMKYRNSSVYICGEARTRSDFGAIEGLFILGNHTVVDMNE